LLPEPPRLFEIGGASATPLRPFSAVAALGDFARLQPGEEATALERIDESLDHGRVVLLLRRGERFDASSAHLLRLLASGRRDLSWVVAGEIPPSLERAIEPERAPDSLLFVVSPTMSARADLLRLLDALPLPERAGWLRGFVASEQFDRFLDEGLVPPAPAIEATEEPRRSYLAALAIAGQQVPAAAASRILRELGWLRPLEELASPALAQVDSAGIEFRSAAVQRALADSLPREARPGLCALAAAALAPLDPWRAKLLELEAGDLAAAEGLAGQLDERRRHELGATIARLPPSLRDSRLVVELHARALLEEGRYRLALEEAARVPGDERALLTARIERRLGRYAAAESTLAPLVARKRAPAQALIAAAELARLRGNRSAAADFLVRAAVHARDDELPAIAYERALVAFDEGVDVDPADVAAVFYAPYLASRLATYLALGGGDDGAARCEAERAMGLARTPLERIDASLDLFFALFLEGDWDLARMRGRECLALVEETDGDRAAGGVLFTLGFLFADRGEWERAEDALERLRIFYAHASDLRRLRETSLVAAHLAFSRGRYAEARAHVSELDLEQLSDEEREASVLILDEIDWIEGIVTPLRSRGGSRCRELRDRRQLLLRRREGAPADAIQRPFLRRLAEWEAAVERGAPAEPPEPPGPADSLALLRSMRAARRAGAPVGSAVDDLARRLGVDPEPPRPLATASAAAGELEILQRVAALTYPFLPSDLAGRSWLFARRNRLGVWNQVGSLDPAAAEVLDATLDEPPADWIRCSDDAVLFLEGVGSWSEGSRRSIASLFLIRSEHWALKRAIDQGSTIAEPRENDPEGIVGESRPIRDLFVSLGRVARREVTICIEGESGVGKELIARAIHDASPRRSKPFVPLNCAVLPENLIESELFGHARGAFTGADRDRPGLIEAASGGTLFLDEIGEMPMSAQAKLLRFLQESEFRRVGESATRRADVRVVAATNRRLEAEVDQGRFREDLYYRIRGVELRVPPLRERGDDVLLLARYFLAREHRRHGGASSFSEEVESALTSYSWPGNVRELEHALRSAHAFAGEAPVIALEHLSARLREARPLRRANGNYYDEVTRFRRNLVERSLAESEGNQTHAARLLGISRQALAYQIRELGVLVAPAKRR
ncbi:MAG: sigma 54-interacting transcriptional regulator, partial [Acidobacteria bacterium]|nr:sigma 54-interacting transcriptional regulator [Acidobacteriota bacterium]